MLPRRKTYWLVMLRTRLCYDFAGHVRSIMTCDECIVGKMRRIHQPMGSSGFTQYLSWINDLTREVLLYNYKICPNVDSFLKMQVCAFSPLEKAYLRIIQRLSDCTHFY